MPILYEANCVTLTEIVLPSSSLILLEKKEVMDSTYVIIPFPIIRTFTLSHNVVDLLRLVGISLLAERVDCRHFETCTQ